MAGNDSRMLVGCHCEQTPQKWWKETPSFIELVFNLAYLHSPVGLRVW